MSPEPRVWSAERELWTGRDWARRGRCSLGPQTCGSHYAAISSTVSVWFLTVRRAPRDTLRNSVWHRYSVAVRVLRVYRLPRHEQNIAWPATASYESPSDRRKEVAMIARRRSTRRSTTRPPSATEKDRP